MPVFHTLQSSHFSARVLQEPMPINSQLRKDVQNS